MAPTWPPDSAEPDQADGLCPSAWLPIPADRPADNLPPLPVSTHSCTASTHCITCVCARESVFQWPCLFVCPRVYVCANTWVCFGALDAWWRHILTSHYALAQKVLPDHANAEAWGAPERWEEMSARNGMCVYIMHMSRSSTHQNVKPGGCSRCLHGQLNLYHVCHRKIKALVYSGALLTRRLAYQSKGDDMEDRSFNRAAQTRLDQGYNCRHVAPFHGWGEEMKPGHLKKWGSERDGHVSAFLI